MRYGEVRRERNLVLTDKGRRALAFDKLGLALPCGYSAWGAPESEYCPEGHRLRRRGARACWACLRREWAAEEFAT